MRAKALTLSLIYLLLLGSVLPAEEIDLLNDYWQKLFTEPFETAYIYMKDYTFFPYTSHYEDLIYMEIGRLEEALQKKGYEIKDIAVIIHNHLKDCTFSAEDHKQYRRFKKYGFRGLFLLYSNITNKVYDIEDKKKDLT